MEKRIKWIDIARGFAFLMIIYSHIEYTNKFVMAYFTPILLTTFFFVSGYLFNNKRSFVEIVEHRFRTILIPFFIYGTLNITLSQIITFENHPSLSKDLIDFIFQIRGNNDGLWFLACLFVSTIPFYFMVKYTRDYSLLALSILLFIINNIVNFKPLPWHIQLIPSAIFYMALGYLFKRHEKHFSFTEASYSIPLLLLIYLFGVTFYYKHFAHSVSFTAQNYIIDGLALTIVGLFLCISISKQLNKFNVLLVFIGSNSLLYFCLHGKVYSLLQKISHKMLSFYDIDPSHFLSFNLGIAVTLLTAILLIVPVWIINKFLPWTTGKGFYLINKANNLLVPS